MGIRDKLFGADKKEEPQTRSASKGASPEIAKLVKSLTEGSYDKRQEAQEKLAAHPEREQAIQPLMEYFRKHKDESYTVANALGAIGTEAAIEPLLEIFQTVHKGRLSESGFAETDYEDSGGAPSSNLVCLKCGLSSLRQRCSPELYEEILLRAHNYSSRTPEANRALGEIGNYRAIRHLLSVLWQQQWKEETRQPAIDALVKIGKPALPELCKELKRSIPEDRKFQTGYRREILRVLAVSGDKSCIDSILSVAKSDATIEKEARETVAAIAQRDTTVSVPEEMGAPPKPIRTIAATGDPYVDSCFTFDFQEVDEARDWYGIEELRKVTELGNQDKVREAMSLLESIWGQYTDFDFVYIWKAVLRDKMGKIDDARAVIHEGLTRCKKKYSLCNQLATIEFESGSLAEAVRWWIKSAAAQISIGQTDSVPPFLYLAYIAEALGDRASSDRLLSEVDKIRPGQIRLDGTGQSKVFNKVSGEGNDSMRRAIQLLCQEYLS